jgi:hypothetical protein
VKRWINDAMHEIDVLADWPYKLAPRAALSR